MPQENAADIIVVGSGNAALCAGIAALEAGASVLIIEKAPEELRGGNSSYTAGAMRFVYDGRDDLMPLLSDPDDERLPRTEFGAYTAEKFAEDLLGFNGGRPLSAEQKILIARAYETMLWLASHGVTFEPIWSRQSFTRDDGTIVFWGGLTLAARNEGVGLVDAEIAAFKRLGGTIRYEAPATGLITEDARVVGVDTPSGPLRAKAVILGSGGFEASTEKRVEWMGDTWKAAKVRGTPHNTGDGLTMALELGAARHGLYPGAHATPMDLHMKDFGNLDLPAGERKNYRKICYFLGVMLNAEGKRFVDEGKNFRNYTYAQFGRAVLEQPGGFAWQIFDAKVMDLLYAEYTHHDAYFVEADTLAELISELDGVDRGEAARTLAEFNTAVDEDTKFDPTILDGKSAKGLTPARTNWAQKIDQGPFRAYPVTGGITFTYGGLKVDESGSVMKEDGTAIAGLHACGELVGGVFFEGYPGGSGLTSGAVFGRLAGAGAAATLKR
ncbi:MAG: FAD-dependent tricarballylate dehydrogenase TcuA [Pseudomonadota bacterium]